MCHRTRVHGHNTSAIRVLFFPPFARCSVHFYCSSFWHLRNRKKKSQRDSKRLITFLRIAGVRVSEQRIRARTRSPNTQVQWTSFSASTLCSSNYVFAKNFVHSVCEVDWTLQCDVNGVHNSWLKLLDAGGPNIRTFVHMLELMPNRFELIFFSLSVFAASCCSNTPTFKYS